MDPFLHSFTRKRRWDNEELNGTETETEWTPPPVRRLKHFSRDVILHTLSFLTYVDAMALCRQEEEAITAIDVDATVADEEEEEEEEESSDSELDAFIEVVPEEEANQFNLKHEWKRLQEKQEQASWDWKSFEQDEKKLRRQKQSAKATS